MRNDQKCLYGHPQIWLKECEDLTVGASSSVSPRTEQFKRGSLKCSRTTVWWSMALGDHGNRVINLIKSTAKYLSYFSIAVKRYHGQHILYKKRIQSGFAYSFRECVYDHCDRKQGQQIGRLTAGVLPESLHLIHKLEAVGCLEWNWVLYEHFKPQRPYSVIYFLLSHRAKSFSKHFCQLGTTHSNTLASGRGIFIKNITLVNLKLV